jgi:hypothetical protein
MLTPGRMRSLAVVAGLLALGQLVLLALAPLTRASGTFARLSGPAILVPDSAYYLSPGTLGEVFSLPWTRWGYPLLLSLGGTLADPALAAVGINALALLVGGYVLHRTTEARAGGTAALVAAAILVANPMTAQWLRIVGTEAVFFGGVAVIAGLSIRVLDRTARRLDRAALLLVAILAAITRPNGFLVAIAALVLVASAQPSGVRRRVATIAVAASAIVLLPIAYTATGPPSEGSIAQQLYAGVVIEGTEHVRTTITMPAPADPDDETFGGAARFALAHPFATMRVAVARLAMETAQLRRHYPTVVNVAFAFAMLLLAGSVASGWTDARARASRTTFLVIGTPLMLLTMATFAVPESRYGWAYLLPLAPIAGVGVDRWTGRFRRVEAFPPASTAPENP